MPPLRVVEAVDPLRDRQLRTIRVVVALAVEKLEGERAEEALDYRVVPGVSGAAHAASQPVLVGLPHVLVAAVDAAAVRVHDDVARVSARLERARSYA